MKRFYPILIGLVMTACSTETPAQTGEDETSPSAEAVTASAEPVAKERAPLFGQGNMEKRYIDAMETGFESQMKLYTRVSPDAAALIKPVSFDQDDRETIRCVIRGYKDAGMEKYLELGIDMNKRLNRLIDENPDLSMRTIESHPEAMHLLSGGDVMEQMSEAESDAADAINSRCGTMTMMMQKMTDSGVMAAMQSQR
jgi:hypothetical protein